MNKNQFCEELYTTFPGVIVPGRKGILMPLSMAVVGGALTWWSNSISANSEVLRYLIMLVGASLLLIGLTVLVVRLCNKRGLPYFAKTNKPLTFTEMSFSKDQANKVKELVVNGDIKALRAMPKHPVSAVAVMVYAADNDEFVAMQAFSYAELDYHPLTSKVYLS